MTRFMTFLMAALFGAALAATATSEEEREGGIMGTGIRPAGIVGTITHLGSIHVNGQHIRFADTLPVQNGISLRQAGALRPGHTVAVIAQPDPTGRAAQWQASQIRQITPLLGPARVAADGSVSILGTQVDISATGQQVRDGAWVAISGLWQEDHVVASRIDPAPPGIARLEGSAWVQDGSGALRVGGTQVLGLIPRHLRDGDVVRLSGRPLDGGLFVSQLETGLFEASPGLILAEGYLSPPTPSGLYTVLGLGIVSYTDQPAMIDKTIRQLTCSQAGRLSFATQAPSQPQEMTQALSSCTQPQ